MKFNKVIKSFLIVLGVFIIAAGWTAAISITGMPDWYYGLFLAMIPFGLVWGFIYYIALHSRQVNTVKKRSYER